MPDIGVGRNPYYEGQFDAEEPADTQARLVMARDAARYRWLRDGCCDKDSVATRIAQNEYGMEWDAAIDAAMTHGRAS